MKLYTGLRPFPGTVVNHNLIFTSDGNA